MLSLRRLRPAAPIVGVAFARPAQPVSEAPAAFRSRRKRVFDVTVAILLLVLTAPVWLAIAALIKLSSPGPVLFRQERAGVNGRRFTILKFRTMHDGVSEEAHRRFIIEQIRNGATAGDGVRPERGYKLNGDARITPIGRFLRRTSIDELPQELNVLAGDMSLVGPRPALAYEIDHYEPWQMERLTVRPGLTGLWQVSGRNRLSYTEMCALDIAYVRGWTFRRDLSIALRTPWVMFVDGGGAS
jgi:lipopolysaccharide/colanic/teichoic acid biosynthesis glycosyltransferase